MRDRDKISSRRTLHRMFASTLALATLTALLTPGGIAFADPSVEPFSLPAVGPIMQSGTVGDLTPPGALAAVADPTMAVGGIAVAGGNAYIVDGTRIARVDKLSGETTPLAGVAGSTDCEDGISGSTARFAGFNGGVRMAGSDGRFIYVSDACGLRRIDPTSGATTTVTTTWYRWTSIAGQYLYGFDNTGVLYEHNLGTPASMPRTVAYSRNNGAIAADASAVWMMDTWGGILYRIDSSTGTVTTASWTLPAKQAASAMISVGDYLYASLRGITDPLTFNTLVRISKTTGATVLIAPGGNGGKALSSVVGIASDNAKLYLADSQTNGAKVRTVVASTSVPFAEPANAEFVGHGLVKTSTTSGPGTGTPVGVLPVGGVTVVGGAAFLIDGTHITRVDRTTGTSAVLAGAAGSTACQDGDTGMTARFVPFNGGVRMAGSDGRFVYVSDACGLRRVDPVTGATTTVDAPWYRWTSIAGQYLYGFDNYDGLFRHDLTGSDRPKAMASFNYDGAIAADADGIWMMDTWEQAYSSSTRPPATARLSLQTCRATSRHQP